MADYYTTQTISGYNSSPPADDGSQVSANEVTWAKHKTKLADPIKTLAEAINTQLLSAFGKMFFNGISAIATDTTVGTGDLGKLLSVTGTTTITMPAVATATEGFVVTILNSGSNTVTVDGDGSETINGSATITLEPGDFAVITTTGSTGWEGPVTSGGFGGLTPTNNNFITGNGTAWISETAANARTSMGLGALATLATVGAAQIDTDAVTNAKIATGAVGSDEIASGAVITSKFPALTAGSTYKLYYNPHGYSSSGGAYAVVDQLHFMVPRGGTFTVSFNIKVTGGGTGFARVYKNGAAFGTEYTTTSASYETKSESLTFAAGDRVDIYLYQILATTVDIEEVFIASAVELFG